jgi:hypothetical protein
MKKWGSFTQSESTKLRQTTDLLNTADEPLFFVRVF